MAAAGTSWLDCRRDPASGIEWVRGFFPGHAFDLHSHDEVLVGVTEQGVQKFRCRGTPQTSTPGRAILIEPGEAHDGDSPEPAGFTYSMLYLPLPWLLGRAAEARAAGSAAGWPGFRTTLVDRPALARSILGACGALREGDRLARDQHLDRLVVELCEVAAARHGRQGGESRALTRALALLNDDLAADIGLDDLAAAAGIDRFRLHREFRRGTGLAPHAYRLQLRLRAARRRLAEGLAPANVAAEVGFSDQSHLGRWFRRAYGTTPAAYRRLCTGVPD